MERIQSYIDNGYKYAVVVYNYAHEWAIEKAFKSYNSAKKWRDDKSENFYIHTITALPKKYPSYFKL